MAKTLTDKKCIRILICKSLLENIRLEVYAPGKNGKILSGDFHRKIAVDYEFT